MVRLAGFEPAFRGGSPLPVVAFVCSFMHTEKHTIANTVKGFLCNGVQRREEKYVSETACVVFVSRSKNGQNLCRICVAVPAFGSQDGTAAKRAPAGLVGLAGRVRGLRVAQGCARMH
jgi:hypothetical protein